MKIKDIKDLSKDELKQKLGQLKEEYFKLNIRKASGQLESTASLANIRKDVARINTVLRQREERS
ncbi:MAG TPA: 50S ribosomal protein L29 [Syntrophales bacterium]|jgi:large subunit ribosomal protein L29|nr:50S ribosomal protein L29 [Syntrophales bacterium]HPX55766.1 50S ribosomal protein L29 [Syntrophales bacterium]HQA82471.1 50S ribosomal protein L29 [Syntrophales bacterium]